jgi:hypothetical protein
MIILIIIIICSIIIANHTVMPALETLFPRAGISGGSAGLLPGVSNGDAKTSLKYSEI